MYCRQIGRSSPRRARTSATFSGVARSPSIVSAGSPGIRWMKLKTRTETPRSTGTMVRLRRMAYRLTAPSSRLPARPALLHLDGVEVLGPRRVRHVALHALRERQRRLVVGDEEPPDVVAQKLLGLPVELRPLRLLRELLGAQEHVGQRLVAVEALARGAGLAEEVAQEIVGIPVVPRPAEHVERHLAVLALVEVHRPLGRLQLRLDADLREIRRHRLGDLLRVREVWPRARHVPEHQRLFLAVLPRDIGQALRMAGLAEQRLRLSRAVLVVLQLAVVAPERGGLELAGDEPGAAVERVDDPALVDRLREGLAHALVLELLHLVVEGDVARRVRGAQQELEIRIALDH